LKQKFLIIDASQLYYSCKHVITRGSDSERVGMMLHIIFNSIQKTWKKHNVKHIVMCFDGKSWRKDYYKPYKKNRLLKKAARSEEEIRMDVLFKDAFNDFQDYITNHTNCTVLYNPSLESDDLIAGFIFAHPEDEHVVVSNDKDFEQLIAPNVSLYNAIKEELTTIDGIYDMFNKKVIDKKTGKPKMAPSPEFSIFEKAIRGCPTDNIFSAYPGIREKSSKKKIGLMEAFEDRHKQGFAWTSVMMHRWEDHDGVEHRVINDFKRNQELVDLSAQPEHIKILMAETIADALKPKSNPSIGFKFIKFCGKYELVKLSEQASNITSYLCAPYEYTC
jgi:5'-3' exonuclease